MLSHRKWQFRVGIVLAVLLAASLIRGTVAGRVPVRVSRWVATARHPGSGPLSGARGSSPRHDAVARAIAASGHHPILFEANQGQSDTEVKFIARNGGATLFLTATEAVFMWSIGGTGRLPTEAPLDPRISGRAGAAQAPARVTVRQRWVGANSHPHVVGMDPIAATSHYFIGNDPRQWRTNVPLFNKVHYQEVYPGIDVDYYGAQGRLEYDIVVAPHADPTPIRLGFEGARALT